MPIATIVQNPGIVWDSILQFPSVRDLDVYPQAIGGTSPGRVLWSVGAPMEDSNYQQKAWLGGTLAGGGGTATLEGSAQMFYRLTAGAGGFVHQNLSACRALIDTGNATDIAQGCEMADAHKAWWLKWVMRSSSGAPNTGCGVNVAPLNNRNDNPWPTNVVGANNHGGFGFVGDGAGQWQYASWNRAGASLLREAVALPAHNVGNWNMFELFVINARPGIPATLEIWFNGVLIGTRNWQGADIENYAANEANFCPAWRGSNAQNTEIRTLTCRMGRYTRSGLAL